MTKKRFFLMAACVMAAAGAMAQGNGQAGITAVSYTHLDVYKRQPCGSSSMRRKRAYAFPVRQCPLLYQRRKN